MSTRREEIFQEKLDSLHVEVDHTFFWLLLVQWGLAAVFALVVSPHSWAGKQQLGIHPHVWIAIVFGGILNAAPLTLIQVRPGWWLTRHVVAASQMLWSAIFIHLTGGRIETHFHIFASLAFVAFYRDWKLLVTATAVVAADHLARGLYWPESVYGIANPEWWRFLEHASWVAAEDLVLILGCARELTQLRNIADQRADLEGAHAQTECKVVERTEELAEAMTRFKSLVEDTNAVPWEYDLDKHRLLYMAPQAARLLRCTPEQLRGARNVLGLIHQDDRERLRSALVAIDPTRAFAGSALDYRMLTGDGGTMHVHTILNAREPGTPLRALTIDITKQRELELELQQSQKLESVGRLASGVAHEINTPVQFVSDSVFFVREALQTYAAVIAKLQVLQQAILSAAPPEQALADATSAKDTADDNDLGYLMERVPQAMDRALEGLDRIAVIVRSMKEFAHPDGTDATTADLNRAVESTLVMARSEYKYVADVETDFGDLPPVTCHIGDINQAVLNIVVNAAHAIGDVVKGTEGRGRISITTRQEGDEVVIAVSDTGSGIPESARAKIFDPFFTTKQVGKGTGQGLAISRSVIVEKHKGQLTFETEVGKGTTFFIRLPVGSVSPAPASAPPEAAAA